MECAPHTSDVHPRRVRLEPRRTAQYMMGRPIAPTRTLRPYGKSIRDGSIDWMGSDHSPFTTEQKTKDMRFHADPDDMPVAWRGDTNGLAGI